MDIKVKSKHKTSSNKYLLRYTVLTTNTQIHHYLLLLSWSNGLIILVGDAIVVSGIQIQNQIIVNGFSIGVQCAANGADITTEAFGLHQKFMTIGCSTQCLLQTERIVTTLFSPK